MMGKMVVDIDDLVVTVAFTVKDLYSSTPLGCHAGCLGNVSSTCKPKNNPQNTWGVSMGANKKKLEDGDLYRKIMDEFVKGAREGWGGMEGVHYRDKGHWIISAPWGYTPATDIAPGEIGTRELMDLISQFCDHEPEKYGRYTMTQGTDCGVHDNNSGRPCTRTMIWHRPGLTVTMDKLLTRVTGVYKPIQVVKKPEPIKVKLPKVLTKLPRPKRREFQAKKAPKQYGPPPRVKYKRAA